MNIPFVDLSRLHRSLNKKFRIAIDKVILHGDFILGRAVSEFESNFASFCGVKYALGVSSGTAALHLALKAMGIKCGDGVIVPVNTFIATALAVVYANAVPVFIDCDPQNYNLDVSKLEDTIKNSKIKIKAVIPVHLYGQPSNMPAIMEIAGKYNLCVVEDACQSHGAKVKMGNRWRPAGSIGDVGCFSFYPGKNLGCFGDGGMVITDKREIYERLKMMRDLGQKEKYHHLVVGYNSRLDTIQAAVLNVKLKYLSEWNDSRKIVAEMYKEALRGGGCILPFQEDYVMANWHLFVIRIKERDKLRKHLTDKGISTGIHYPYPLHLTPALSYLGYKVGDFPEAEKICNEILSLPIFPHLQKSEVRYVVESLKEFYK